MLFSYLRGFILYHLIVVYYSAQSLKNTTEKWSEDSEVASSPAVEKKRVIHLLGLPALTSTTIPVGHLILPSVNYALDQVNARDDVLPNYHLKLHWRDTKCEPGPGVDAMYHLLFSPPVKTMIVGASCSTACEPIAQASRLWNITHIAFGCGTPTLSNRQLFPNFFRCTPSEAAVIPVFLELLEAHNWRKVAIITEAQEYWSMFAEELHNALDEANITVLRSEIFLGDPSLQVANLQKQDVRIIFGGFYENSAPKVLCEAYKIGFYGPKIVWIFVSWYRDNYWRLNSECTAEQILEVIGTSVLYAGVDVHNPSTLHTPTVGNVTRYEAFQYLDSVLGEGVPSKFAMPLFYDAIWATALVLNKTVAAIKETGFPRNLEDFTYQDLEMTRLISSQMEGLEFQGLLGLLRWRDKNSPEKDMLVQQQCGETREVVGWRKVGKDNITWSDRGIIWERGFPPRDSEVAIFELISVNDSIYNLMCSLAAIGMLCSVAFLAFNIYFRKKKVIKMSSPNINNVILLGCLISYTTVFFNATRDEVLPPQVSCITALSTILIGFSLTFGALFSKTWRIHVIMRTSKKSLKKVVIKDTKLVGIVIALVLVDVFMVVLWQVVDLFTVVINTGTPQESTTDPDVWIVPQTKSCQSNYQTYFAAVLYGIQGLMLAFGVFLAWETRQVTLAALNDSKEIGMCIYNVLILSVMGVLINLVVDDIDIRYGFISATIFAATALTQGIIFVPKIVALKRDDQMGTITRVSAIHPNKALSTNNSTGGIGNRTVSSSATGHLSSQRSDE